jgi:hypothetical protein
VSTECKEEAYQKERSADEAPCTWSGNNLREVDIVNVELPEYVSTRIGIVSKSLEGLPLLERRCVRINSARTGAVKRCLHVGLPALKRWFRGDFSPHVFESGKLGLIIKIALARFVVYIDRHDWTTTLAFHVEQFVNCDMIGLSVAL